MVPREKYQKGQLQELYRSSLPGQMIDWSKSTVSHRSTLQAEHNNMHENLTQTWTEVGTLEGLSIVSDNSSGHSQYGDK